jgi:hypothetical protein
MAGLCIQCISYNVLLLVTGLLLSSNYGRRSFVALAEGGVLLLQHEGDNGVVWVLCRQVTN